MVWVVFILKASVLFSPYLLAVLESGIGLAPYDAAPSLCPHPPAWGGPGHQGGQEAVHVRLRAATACCVGIPQQDFKTTLRSCFSSKGA